MYIQFTLSDTTNRCASLVGGHAMYVARPFKIFLDFRRRGVRAHILAANLIGWWPYLVLKDMASKVCHV